MAQLVTDLAKFETESRIVAIRLAGLTLRLRASWSALFGSPDAAAVMLAIAAIRSERLLRERTDAARSTLSVALPGGALGPCNISSIATASGFNKETARRKVNELIASGMLVREAGEIRFSPGFTQRETFVQAIASQLDDIRGVANDLLREAVIKIEN